MTTGVAVSKLGVYIQLIPDLEKMRNFLLTFRPRIIKSMQPNPDLLGGWPSDYNPLVIGRKYFDRQELKNPRGVARSIVDGGWGRAVGDGLVHAMELYNEIKPHDGAKWRYVEWQLEAVDELAKYNIPYIADNWSVGNPSELDADGNMVYYEDSRVHELLAHPNTKYLAVHEYDAPAMWDNRGFDPPYDDKWDYLESGWLVLRYRKIRKQLEAHMRLEDIPPFLITECGIDGGAPPSWDPGGVQGGGGYHSFCSIDSYLEQLLWYDWHLRQDDYVEGATPFLLGGNDDWVSFDLWPDRELYGQAIRSVGYTDTSFDDWLAGTVPDFSIPFVPENYIERMGLSMGWIPVSDETVVSVPEDHRSKTLATHITVKVFVARAVVGGFWTKKIVWWNLGKWTNYKVIEVPL